MIQIEDTIVSFDIFVKKFCCDLAQCRGICCVEGDSGAPLEEDEPVRIVTNMSDMFNGCGYLETLDVSNFNTQNVTDMSFMFFNCSAITTLEIAKFDTKNVTVMRVLPVTNSGPVITST